MLALVEKKLPEIRLRDMCNRELELLGEGDGFSIVGGAGDEPAAMPAEMSQVDEDRGEPAPLS